jgi:hypothetical protein
MSSAQLLAWTLLLAMQGNKDLETRSEPCRVPEVGLGL